MEQHLSLETVEALEDWQYYKLMFHFRVPRGKLGLSISDLQRSEPTHLEKLQLEEFYETDEGSLQLSSSLPRDIRRKFRRPTVNRNLPYIAGVLKILRLGIEYYFSRLTSDSAKINLFCDVVLSLSRLRCLVLSKPRATRRELEDPFVPLYDSGSAARDETERRRSPTRPLIGFCEGCGIEFI